MNDLIARLEAATGPDRELDGAIFWFAKRAQAVRYFHNAAVGRPSQSLPDELPAHGLGRHAVVQFSPHYTASLDAAISLVPEGCFCDTQRPLRGTAIFDRPLAWAQIEETDGPLLIDATAPTLPLALCIAALKARDGKRDAHSTGDPK